MKYYSETLKKMFNSVEELDNAEKELLEQKEEEKKALAVKKEDAKEVEDAFKAYVEIKNKAYDEIKQAEKVFIEKKNAFVKKYGCYHMTYTSSGDKPLLDIKGNLDKILFDLDLDEGTYIDLANKYINKIFNQL